MPDELGAPDNPSELYRARGSEVVPERPFVQGDVLRAIEIPGVDDGPGLALIVQHACSMRQGASLRDKLFLARVRVGPRIPPAMWRRGHFGCMPLPELIPGDETWYQADFEACGLVRSSGMSRADRIACLDDFGIALLQQRQAHYMTRVIVELEAFAEVLAPVLAEAELMEDWSQRSGLTPDQSEAEFHDFVTAPLNSLEGRTLQNDLKDPSKRSAVRRSVVREAENRYGTTSSTVSGSANLEDSGS